MQSTLIDGGVPSDDVNTLKSGWVPASDGSEVNSTSTTRSRRRASASRSLHGKIVAMQNQLDEVQAKLDLVLGGISLLLDKSTTTTSAMPTPFHSFYTPPHHIGHLPSITAQPSSAVIPPFPSFAEFTPTIDMAKIISTG